MTIIRMMNAKGKAARIAPVCRPFNPPDHSKTAAATDWMTPHVNLIELGGFRFPWVVKVPRTKVAESAEVIKNVPIKKMATMDMIEPMGNCSRRMNKATSIPRASMTCLIPTCSNRSSAMAVPPNTENQNAQKIVGTRRTPRTNSRTVRPLEILAMNIPTNGAQAIHQAQ